MVTKNPKNVVAIFESDVSLPHGFLISAKKKRMDIPVAKVKKNERFPMIM